MFPSSSGRPHVGDFGDKFRKAREKKEISLDDVSNVTKISSRMLRAIEEEHFDQLPGGVFNKGFIRAYAKHLGLNDEEAVTEYLACLRQAQIDAHEVWEPERPRIVAAARVAPPHKRVLVEPAKTAAKSHAPAQVEELPDLQLPRAEHVRPAQKDFGETSSPDIPWRIIAVAARRHRPGSDPLDPSLPPRNAARVRRGATDSDYSRSRRKRPATRAA